MADNVPVRCDAPVAAAPESATVPAAAVSKMKAVHRPQKGGGSATTVAAEQILEAEGEARVRPKGRGTKKKVAPRRGAAKRTKKAAAKNPRKRTAAKPRKAPKRVAGGKRATAGRKK
ncbi:hypothetical protein chiPu_0020038 [Chiloscyllium punctatum]|uniref:Uncharacterized protein n=1 Tax=Chiloscyllium punctatum TaxID=137246 RepID=A0A401RTU1_CHIPU|nr:hypothetical protein [Chiloscyllium punctatum]